jgi:hypothetical protein
VHARIAASAMILPGAIVVAACSGQAQDPVSPEVRAVIERSRHPTTDYTALYVDRVMTGREASSQTSAEYHRGTHQRSETPYGRALLNCATGTEVVYEVRTGKITRREGAADRCGIAYSERILHSRLLPAETGRFGRTDIIELTSRDYVRHYAVTQDGILARSDFVSRRPDNRHGIETIHVEIRRGSPDPAMFEEASLARAFAPAPETLMPGRAPNDRRDVGAPAP